MTRREQIFLMRVKKVDKNIDCKTCDDGVEAISMWTADQELIPNYIFLDVNMRNMNGIECLKEIRKIEKLKNTKLFMYSTTTENNILDESKKLEADDFSILKEKLYNIF